MVNYVGVSYFGGKLGKALDNILPLISSYNHSTYVEPFFGMGGVFFNKDRVRLEVINDLDEEVVNFFRVLRSTSGDKLISDISNTPYSRLEFYLADDRKIDDDIERARRFIVRVGMSIFKYHQKGKAGWSRRVTSSGSSASRWNTFPIKLNIMRDRLKAAQIEYRNALDVIKEYDTENTLMYIDPPYVLESRSSKNDVYKHESSKSLQKDLCDILLNLKHARFVLSGYDNDIYREFLDRFNKMDFELFISSSSGKRKPSTEVMWYNFENKMLKLI